MNAIFRKITVFAFTGLLMSSLSSCVKKEYDTPPDPAGTDPNLVVNTTIANVKALFTSGGSPIRIVDDLIISGIVIADDRSGNFYKEIVIQDNTGGISIQLDQSNYYTDYPVGRRVFIKLRDLYIGEYNKLIQLGGYYTTSGTTYSIERIPQTLISQHIIKGSYYHEVTPILISVYNLSQNSYKYQNMLIQLKEVEFRTAFSNVPYANGPNFTDVNMEIEDCCSNLILLRNSDYANFGTSLTPEGKGSITGVFQVYNSDAQLKIRDLGDVSMNGPRCGSSSISIGTGSMMNLADIRSLFTGCPAIFTSGTKIRGTVISDLSTNNINAYNLVMQDATGGIVVRLFSTNTFQLNDSIEIDLSNDSLSSFNGLLQINYVDNTDVTLKGTGTVIPRQATISQINANTAAWESTLLQINNATLSGGTGVYSGSVTLTDPTGTFELYTRSSATFSGASYPATGTHTVTGYLSVYSPTYELIIRNTTDVQ